MKTHRPLSTFIVFAILASSPLLHAASAVAAPDDTAAMAAAEWSETQDLPYDSRARVHSAVKTLEACVSRQVKELEAARAAMQGNAYVKDWDFAMKEMRDSQSYLKSVGEELHKATPETWRQQKDKVGAAWARTQEAYSKVRSSTTASRAPSLGRIIVTVQK